MARILVIDDDQAIRTVMRRVLEKAGHVVTEAEDGEAGLALLEEELPDMVVTDLLMPEKEGIETILEMRQSFPDLPVLAVSGADGGVEEGPLLDARLLGADSTLSKPFSLEEFLEAVEDVLRKS